MATKKKAPAKKAAAKKIGAKKAVAKKAPAKKAPAKASTASSDAAAAKAAAQAAAKAAKEAAAAAKEAAAAAKEAAAAVKAATSAGRPAARDAGGGHPFVLVTLAGDPPTLAPTDSVGLSYTVEQLANFVGAESQGAQVKILVDAGLARGNQALLDQLTDALSKIKDFNISVAVCIEGDGH